MSINRRTLLKHSAAAASAGAMLSASSLSHAESWPHLKRTIVINNLGGIDNPNLWLQKDSEAKADSAGKGRLQALDQRALQDIHASGTTAVNLTIGYVAGPTEPFEHSVNDVAHWNRVIHKHSKDLVKITSAKDIIQAKRDGKVGIILGFQNATMMGDKAERVDTFAGLGVKIIQLTYNVRNQLGDGSMVAANQGLSPFGHEVIERLDHSRTLIDLSHSGENTCLDAIKAATRPICISHSGCRALSDLPRNKTDQELKQLADKGGCVGIYFMPFLKEDSFPNAEDVVRHIEHAINVCGEDHVGIGTDGGTTAVDDMAAFHRAIDIEVKARQAAGISAKGEKPGVVPFIPDLQGPGQFQKLADMLYTRGHSHTRIEKILGRNFLRLQGEVWGA